MDLETINVLFFSLLFFVAFMYSSVGHGGASGYLALMAFFSFAPEVMRPTALLLNIFVSLTAFIQYYRGGHFSWKLFLPFAVASVPAAFLGGLINIDAGLYKTILGILLLFNCSIFFYKSFNVICFFIVVIFKNIIHNSLIDLST